MSRDLLDLVHELNTLNDDNLADRVIENSDVQWCLSELQDILEEMPTLPPPNEWVSVEDAAPDPGERVLATDGIFVGEAYRSSANSWFRHTGFPWRDGVTGRTVRFWMPLPEPPDKDNNVLAKTPNEPLTLKQLREMDGEPVWVVVSQNWRESGIKSGWRLVKFHINDDRIRLYMFDTHFGASFFAEQDMGLSYWVYRRPPEGEEDA